MNTELWLGVIFGLLGALITELIAGFVKQRIKSGANSRKSSPMISIGNSQFEIKGLSEEKKKEFDLLASTVIILHPETGLPHGTGFVVNDKRAITTFHAINLASADTQEKVVHVKFAVTGDIYQAKVVESWIEQDIAIIEFDKLLPAGITPLEIETGNIKAGNKFRTFGYGGRNSLGLWANGEILGVMRDNENQERIQLASSEIIPGMSGAPIIDAESHKVVGILTAVYAEREKSRHNTIAFATPISEELIRKAT